MDGRSNETLSILIPVYNEEGNLSLLYEKLVAALKKVGRPYEVILLSTMEALDGTIGNFTRSQGKKSKCKNHQFFTKFWTDRSAQRWN